MRIEDEESDVLVEMRQRIGFCGTPGIGLALVGWIIKQGYRRIAKERKYISKIDEIRKNNEERRKKRKKKFLLYTNQFYRDL